MFIKLKVLGWVYSNRFINFSNFKTKSTAQLSVCKRLQVRKAIFHRLYRQESVVVDKTIIIRVSLLLPTPTPHLLQSSRVCVLRAFGGCALVVMVMEARAIHVPVGPQRRVLFLARAPYVKCGFAAKIVEVRLRCEPQPNCHSENKYRLSKTAH